VVAFRWRADQVTDTHGNRMTSTYFEETRLVAGTSTYYDRANYLDTITYTAHSSGNPAPGYSVVFVRESRNGNDVPSFPDEMDNWDTYRLDRIEVKYGANIVRTYDLNYEVRSYYPNGALRQTTVLSSMAVSGGTTSAPVTTFSYIDLNTAPLSQCHPSCTTYNPYLLTINNGWGGSTTYTYGNDARSLYLSWRVEMFDIRDGVNPNPMKTTYTYSGPCYHRDDLQPWCNSQQYGDLVGYEQSIATTKDFNGTTTLGISLHKFYTI
jgi:hypothetical protein